ncbi:hypothetical protein [Chitinimonas sp. BJYL2]|uniref:hypothetical protein n=1 Tax=Chitinimonas sp. BJYL2 TaxID=2976696 RepID=UPI0022B3AFF8|nr:hypothetical protein [Chitinimonas sp. BJYL2]
MNKSKIAKESLALQLFFMALGFGIFIGFLAAEASIKIFGVSLANSYTFIFIPIVALSILFLPKIARKEIADANSKSL